MAIPELAIDGTFYIEGMLVKTSVGIRDGRIVEIRKGLSADRREETTGIVMPGGIDMHVHMREPGMEEKETISTGTAAALYGGITAVFDMPNTIPPTVTPERVKAKLSLFRQKSHVDFGVIAGLTERASVSSLSKLVPAFKLFMASTTGELMCDDPELQFRLISRVAKTGRLVIVHAEDEKARNKIQERNLKDHYRARPPASEISAVQRIAGMLSRVQSRVHVAHATLKETVEMKEKGGFTVEVCPHHLFLDMDMPLGAKGKVNPPLRRREDRIELFRLVADDRVDTAGSDHAPHTPEEKQDDFDYAPAGMPGVETLYPLLMNEVAAGTLRVSTVSRMLCEMPSKLLGLNKGKIRVGMDADFTIFDLKNRREISADRLHYKCGWTAFEGMEAIFPTTVFLRGEKVLSKGEMVSGNTGREAAFGQPGN